MNATADFEPILNIYVHFDNQEHIAIKIPQSLDDIMLDIRKCDEYSKQHNIKALSLKSFNHFMDVKTFQNVLVLNEFSKINYTYLSSINTLADSFDKQDYSTGIHSIIHGIANKHDNIEDLNKTIIDRSIKVINIDDFALICSMDYKMDHNNLKWLS
ncbi:hypothetical protein DY119_06440 [Apilactobacillus micheneri]|nr:hypothetical protein DY119_06440 [Apilactobacillus micheneri]